MAATHSSSLLKRAVALLILVIPALAALGVVGPTSPAKAATDGKGYWEVASDGGIFSFGDAEFQGSMGGSPLNQPIVGMAAHPSGDGYWFVAADGGIFSFGASKFFGSMGGSPLNRPIVGMAAHPSGEGYWLVADDGGIFSFGASKFFGSMGGSPLNQPIVGMAAHPSGNGYWFVAADGGIFSFGDSKFFGSMGGSPLNQPIVGMAAHPSGNGYWFVASDGGIFSFGDAKFFGSMGGQRLNLPIVGMAAHPSGNGYWFVASDGGIFSFGDSKFFGSMGGSKLNRPVVGMAATPDSTKPTATVNQASTQDDPTDDTSVEFTVTFSEPVSGFTGSDVTIGGTAGATTATVTGGPNTYTVSVTGMANDGTVTVSVPANAAVDSSGNGNAVATSTDNSVTYDNTDPGATVTKAAGQADPASTAPINFTVVFSEPVSGFTGTDVAIGGTTPGTKTATVTGSGTTYNVAVSGMTGNGDVTVTVPAGAAFDAAGNGNTDSTVPTGGDNTVAYDAGRPSAAVSTADGQENPTDEETIDFKVVFSEEVTDFDDLGDVAVGGTAAGTKAWVITGSGDTYNVAVSGVTGTTGTVTVQVLEGKAVDTAGNTNTASNIHTINVDRAGPAVTVAVADGQENPTDEATVDFTVSFTEVVNGFTEDDVALTGDSGANDVVVTDSGDGKNFNVAVSGMTNDGTVTITVGPNAADDSAGNASTGTDAASVTYDNSDPTPTLAKAATQEDPTDESAIDFTVVFDEAVTGFDNGAEDVDITGAPGGTATIGDAGDSDATTYTVTVTGMTGDGGNVTVAIPEGAAADLAGNPSNASNPVTVAYDAGNPTFDSITANGGSTTVVATFSEPVLCSTVQTEEFAAAVGGTSEEVTAAICDGDTDNTIELTLANPPNGGESVAVTYVANATPITDDAGNPVPSPTTRTTTAVSSFTVQVAPAVGQDDPTNDEAVDYTVTFSEAVANNSFTAQDVAVGGTATYVDEPMVTITDSGDSTTYNVAVSGFAPNTTGNVTITIPAGGVVDDDGDLNAASTSNGDTDIAYDNVSPTVTVEPAETQKSPTNEDTLDFTVVFSEVVTGFGTEDLEIGETGTADAEAPATVTITSTDGKTYNVAIDAPTGDGTVTLRVLADGAQDEAENGNQASAVTPASVTVDNTSPGVTIDEADGQSDPSNESAIDFEVTFTEPVFGLTADDFTVTGTAGGSPTGLTTTASPLVYLVTVTGMTQDGDVVLTLPENRATDEAGNPNTASTVAAAGDNVVTRETVQPAPVVTHADADGVTNASPIVFTVDFGEPVDGFTVDDLTITGNGSPTAVIEPNPTGTQETFDVEVSGMTDGPVTLQVKEGGTTDDAGNTNEASNIDTVTYDTEGPGVTVSQHPEQTEDPTDDTQIEFLVVFTEPVSDFDETDVTVAGDAGAGSTATVTPEGTDGTTYKVVVSGMTGDEGDVTVSVDAGRAHDAAGNPNTASNAETVRYDNIAPTFTGIVANAGSTKVFASFNEALDCTSVGTNDFTATVAGAPVVVTAVSCTAPHDDVIELTLSSAPDAGETVEVTLRTSGGGVSDRAGNFTSTQTTHTTTAIPLTTTVTRVGNQYTNGNNVQFTVTFSEPVSGFTAGDVVVSLDTAGPPTVSVSPTTGPEDVYTVTVSAPQDVYTATVSVPAGAATDADGTPNSASNTATATRDVEPPEFVDVDATAADDEVDAIFSEALLCSSVANGDFTVRYTTTTTAGAGVPAPVASTTCAGNTVTITLTGAPPPGTTVEVTLAATGNGVQDLAQNSSGTGTTVTDPA